MVAWRLFAMCVLVFTHGFRETEDREADRNRKVFLTRGAEGGSQCWGARGQAALRVGSRGWRRGRRGGGGRGRRGGGASSRQGGRRGGQPLSRLHICQTQSNQQGYNSKAQPRVHRRKHTHFDTHTPMHTVTPAQHILAHVHTCTHILTLFLSHLTSPEQYFYLGMLTGSQSLLILYRVEGR